MTKPQDVDPQTIDIRAAVGGDEFTRPLTITEQTGKDISGCTIDISVGDADGPGVWQFPDRDLPQANKATRVVQILVGGSLRPTAGLHYVWTRVHDAPEVVPRRQQPLIIVADDPNVVT